MLFVDFWPQGGEKVTLTVPIEIGSTKTQSAKLSPDTNLTQSVGDLTVSMKTDGELKADQYNYVSFPKPGTYKVWFEFIHENRIKQISFVVDVN